MKIYIYENKKIKVFKRTHSSSMYNKIPKECKVNIILRTFIIYLSNFFKLMSYHIYSKKMSF